MFGPGRQPEGLHAGQATKRNCTTTHVFTIARSPDPTFKASETNLQPNLLIFLASLPEKTSGRAFWSSAASFMNADIITMRTITPFQHTPPTHAGLNNTDGSGPVWESFGPADRTVTSSLCLLIMCHYALQTSPFGFLGGIEHCRL